MLTIKTSDKNELTRTSENHFDPNYLAPWCALEHNVDIWFLFDLLATLNYSEGSGNYASKRDQLGKAIMDSMWLEPEGVTQGIYPHSLDGCCVRSIELGGLFITNMDKNKAKKWHRYMERFKYSTKEVDGYTPYHPHYGYPSARQGVWVEGTAGVALFERKLDNDTQTYDELVKLSPFMDEKYGY